MPLGRVAALTLMPSSKVKMSCAERPTAFEATVGTQLWSASSSAARHPLWSRLRKRCRLKRIEGEDEDEER